MPPDDSASNEYINSLQNEIEHLKLSLASANANSGIDVESIVKENADLRIQLDESQKKLESIERTEVSANTIPSTNNDDPSWPQDREEFIKQWSIQANEWNLMREQLEKDKNSYYEIGRAWETESLKFQAQSEDREQELMKCKKEMLDLKEKLSATQSLSSGISQEEFQKKVKQLEMDMAQKWMSLLIRRKKSFLLRRSFDIMRQQQASKKVNTLTTGIQPPPIGTSVPPVISSPPVSTQNYYPPNESSPAQELRHRKTSKVTAEEEKQLQSDFNMIKQLQRSEKAVVIDRHDKVYHLMSSVFYKSIIWLLLIVVAFLYIKNCSVGTSSRPIRLTA